MVMRSGMRGSKRRGVNASMGMVLDSKDAYIHLF